MKKLFLLCCVCILWASQTVAQLNVTFISQLNYTESLNDIWGYAAPDGTEYALVGAANGTSIVSLADPNNPVEVGYVPGRVRAIRKPSQEPCAETKPRSRKTRAGGWGVRGGGVRVARARSEIGPGV